jgi:regulatory protein
MSDLLPEAPNSLNKYTSLAQRRLMDLLAAREHSEAELRAKLGRYLQSLSLASKEPFSTEESTATIQAAIEAALRRAYDRHWLGDPAELSAKVAERLHRKNKGIEFINTYLETKGLPPILQENELELEKAQSLVKNKYSDFANMSEEERPKIQSRAARFLAARGFDAEIVRKVIYEKFGD